MSGPKRCALVALLALRRGRIVPVDAIVDAIWPDGDGVPAAPANAVQHHVTRLRKALGTGTIVAGPEGYALREAEVDALRLEDLLAEARAALRAGSPRTAASATQAALELWGGRPLLGLPEAHWVYAEQTRLEALRLDVLEERFEALLALGEDGTLVPELREALAENPFRERIWRQLMLALYRAGRQADALEAFREARRILSEELGLEPGPELQKLQAAILVQDPAIAGVPLAQRARGNLPAQMTSFVGRAALLVEVQRLVRERRLVTLTGPPGVGKSRLALEAAHALEPDFDGGVWHVDFRRAGDASDVLRLAAEVVETGTSSTTGEPLRRLIGRLHDSESLLVLQECERFPHELGRLAETILAECPRVHVLATSREVLRVPGEHLVPVPPLGVARAGAEAGGIGTEAAELFLERARAVRPGFDPTPAELVVVAEICSLLDGLPAAIELTAARVNALGLRAARRTTSDRIALFRVGEGFADGVEGFLSTLVDWSYDLLHADEKTVLQQVAAFRGGADLAALVAMCARHGLDEPTVTHLLATLVDKSILIASFPQDEPRYDLLTIVRDYVLERLIESDELEETKLAHARFFAALADRAGAELRTSDYGTWRLRLTRDYDNLWTALGYACETSDAELAQRVALGCAWYFVYTNRVSDGRTFVERALAAGDRRASARSLELLGHLTYFSLVELDLETAVATGEEALRIAARVDAPREKAYAEAELAYALGVAGERARADALLAGAREAVVALGEEWYVAGSDFISAIIAARAGDVDAVAAHTDALVSRTRALAFDPWLPLAMLMQAWVAGKRGDSVTEARRYRDVLSRFSADPWVTSIALAGLAEGALEAGAQDEARTLAQQAIRKAKQAHSRWLAAHARVVRARAVAAAGDLLEAGRLYELVASWAQGERTHERMELFFAPLVGSPGSRAFLALAEMAEAEFDEAAAAGLRERALALAEADHVLLEPVPQPAS